MSLSASSSASPSSSPSKTTLYYDQKLNLYFPQKNNLFRFNQQILEKYQFVILCKDYEIFLANEEEEIKIGAISQKKDKIPLNSDFLEKRFALSKTIFLVHTDNYIEIMTYQEKNEKYYNFPSFILLRINISRENQEVNRRILIRTLLKIDHQNFHNYIQLNEAEKKNGLEYRTMTHIFYDINTQNYLKIFNIEAKDLQNLFYSYRKYFSEAELMEEEFYRIKKEIQKMNDNSASELENLKIYPEEKEMIYFNQNFNNNLMYLLENNDDNLSEEKIENDENEKIKEMNEVEKIEEINEIKEMNEIMDRVKKLSFKNQKLTIKKILNLFD